MSGINEDDVIRCMRATAGLPFRDRNGIKKRTIYEGGIGPELRPSGTFHIDFASYPGGIGEEIPADLIASLEAKGILVRAYGAEMNAWILAPESNAKEPR